VLAYRVTRGAPKKNVSSLDGVEERLPPAGVEHAGQLEDLFTSI
jgi:hypothetical protein